MFISANPSLIIYHLVAGIKTHFDLRQLLGKNWDNNTVQRIADKKPQPYAQYILHLNHAGIFF